MILKKNNSNNQGVFLELLVAAKNYIFLSVFTNKKVYDNALEEREISSFQALQHSHLLAIKINQFYFICTVFPNFLAPFILVF